ncbi:MAG: type I methionyl aminopeptidase [Parcubacteria group bacterium]|nr:MAG: type I methionyl aminopeptidase [Parcubacteria group bacterium]
MLDKKTPKEIAILQEGGRILSNILNRLAKQVHPGQNGQELNRLAEQWIRTAGGVPSFLNYHNFPAALCVSVNQTVVHGIPTARALKSGDIVGLDLGMLYKGFFTDMAVTLAVGEVTPEAKRLILAAKKALEVGIAQIRPDRAISDIGRAIEAYIKPLGYGIVRDLAGHGVGRQVHEDPLVMNFDNGKETEKMFPGLVIAIEPMIILGGDDRVEVGSNGWDVNSYDHSLTAHFEHTVAVTNKGHVIITK